MKIVLASASLRRQQLLQKLGLSFQIAISNIDERSIAKKFCDPTKLVEILALKKAEDIAAKLKPGKWLVIGADTVTVLERKIIGKPTSRQEGKEILASLRNQKHQVITGIALLSGSGKRTVFTDSADVYFKNFSDQQIKEYLDTGTYLDRAGAYGIQDPKCDFIAGYKGSYDTILGLPTERLLQILPEFGIKLYKPSSFSNKNRA